MRESVNYPVAGTDIAVDALRGMANWLESCETAGAMASAIDEKTAEIVRALSMLARSAECRRTFLFNQGGGA